MQPQRSTRPRITEVTPSSVLHADRRGWNRFASWIGIVPLVVMATLGVLHSQEQSGWDRPSRPAPGLGVGDTGGAIQVSLASTSHGSHTSAAATRAIPQAR